MARYIIEGSASQQTYAALLKNPHDRSEALRPLFEKMGCKLEAYYFSVGQAKYYAIIESLKTLDPVTIEALVIATLATGANISVSMTQILTSAEMVEAFRKVPELGYHPPTS